MDKRLTYESENTCPCHCNKIINGRRLALIMNKLKTRKYISITLHFIILFIPPSLPMFFSASSSSSSSSSVFFFFFFFWWCVERLLLKMDSLRPGLPPSVHYAREKLSAQRLSLVEDGKVLEKTSCGCDGAEVRGLT